MVKTLVLCLTCGYSLGATDGQRLWIGPVCVRHRLTLYCAACGAKRRWEPATLAPVEPSQATQADESGERA